MLPADAGGATRIDPVDFRLAPPAYPFPVIFRIAGPFWIGDLFLALG